MQAGGGAATTRVRDRQDARAAGDGRAGRHTGVGRK